MCRELRVVSSITQEPMSVHGGHRKKKKGKKKEGNAKSTLVHRKQETRKQPP